MMLTGVISLVFGTKSFNTDFINFSSVIGEDDGF